MIDGQSKSEAAPAYTEPVHMETAILYSRITKLGRYLADLIAQDPLAIQKLFI